MDLKKKIIISLISFWGVGIILAFVFAGILVLQRNLSIPKVQASPGPACQVPDNLEVTGNLTVGGSTPGSIVGSAMSICNARSVDPALGCEYQWGAASCDLAVCGSVSCSSGTARSIWKGRTYHPSDGNAFGYLVICVK